MSPAWKDMESGNHSILMQGVSFCNRAEKGLSDIWLFIQSKQSKLVPGTGSCVLAQQQLQCQPQALPGPSQAGHFGQQLHKPRRGRGCFRVQHMQVPSPTPQPPPNAHHCKIPYKGTRSYHHFTSTLSHGAVEYLPRDLWANSVISQIQLLCPSRHSLGLGPASGSMQKNLTNYLSLENLSISECWLNKCHLTFAKQQQ